MKTTPRAAAPDSRKEGTMNDNKLTILYERLSHEDGRENESLSIEHQKEYLEEYATRNGFTNFVHRTDDGWSGTRWDRPGFLQIMEDIEHGNVGQILIKDMSRLGRDHLRVGLFLEQLRERGVRLIAVAEGIDTAKGEDDFMPFRNIFAEWHARDTSRKIRAIFGARTAAGKHVTGALPYGYLHDPDDRQKWILDEEVAPVVKRIFQGVIEGKAPCQNCGGIDRRADTHPRRPLEGHRGAGEHGRIGRRPLQMGHRHPYPNPQKRRIYGLDSPQQDRHGKLQIQEAGSHPAGKPADFQGHPPRHH